MNNNKKHVFFRRAGAAILSAALIFTSVSDSMRLVSCGISVETASFYCIRN